MAELTHSALLAGAMGFSTSRTPNHKTSDGHHLGTLRAGRAELTAIAGALARAGRGVLQIVSEATGSADAALVGSELELFRHLVETAQRPLSMSIAQSSEAPEQWRTLLDFAQTVTYRGMMFTGVPNMLWIFGYFRASWTLRVDLLADFVCRLLAHMEEKGAKRVEVALRPEDKDMELLPWIDPENFNPGYLMRSMHLLPKRGSKPEWAHTQDYWREKDEVPAIDLDGPEFVYG